MVQPELPRVDVDLKNDKGVNRYYYYIRNGVDSVHVTPLDIKALATILELVPKRLCDFEKLKAELIKEIKDEFLVAIKRSIVEFVLKDPNQEEIFHQVV